jgi:L-arabinose isomerase
MKKKQDKEYYKKYYEKNKKRLSEVKKKYYKKNKSNILEQQKKYYEGNSEKISERVKTQYYEKIEYQKERHRIYYEKNREKILVKQREKYRIDGAEKKKLKRKTDVLLKLKTTLGNRIREFMKQKGYKKNSRTFQIVGCSPQDLRLYLEKLFKEGMTWENHGEWHIDHIIPISKAKTEEEIYKLNHYTNLQPLWKRENLCKGSKIII